jgi:mannosyl-3-phosphoglycerate phosphatase
MKKVLFTDLDGTLLDLHDYSYEPALPAIELVKRHQVPIIFCTAKTLAENEYYHELLGVHDPFIVDNGGAIFVPEQYFSFEFEAANQGKYRVIELGASYNELRAALQAIRAETGFRITGFGDMTVEEVAEDANLTLEQAARAKRKSYNESFIFDEPAEREAELVTKIEAKGFAVTHGGRYYNIHGKNADKGQAVRRLTELFKREYGTVLTIGVGDSRNDIPMLQAVDQPAVVRNKKGGWLELGVPNLYRAEGEGPNGWVEVVRKFISV